MPFLTPCLQAMWTPPWWLMPLPTILPTNDLSANNATGFSALPTDSEDFDSFGMRAYFWSTTQRNSANAYNRYLTHYNTTVYSHPVGKSNGYSVRCLRD